MSILVLKGGLMDSFQDAGRIGYAAQGVNPSGVMDTYAYQIANALAGNSSLPAVLEMHYPAPALRFEKDAIIGLAGADFEANIESSDGSSFISSTGNRTILVAAGSVLTFIRKIRGERCYLAVNGGFKLDKWLKSASTNFKIEKGGYHGRRLQKDDRIQFDTNFEKSIPQNKVCNWSPSLGKQAEPRLQLSVIAGPEWDWLEPVSRAHFTNHEFSLDKQSDRMGIMLNGIPLKLQVKQQLLSSGVGYGTIQLLPNGHMIILGADHPTTGGYPRIAGIAASSLPQLAQAAPGTRIDFVKTTASAEEKKMLEEHQSLAILKTAIRFQLAQF